MPSINKAALAFACSILLILTIKVKCDNTDNIFVSNACSRKWVFGDEDINGNTRQTILNQIDSFNDDELHTKAYNKSLPNHKVKILPLFNDEPREVALEHNCETIDKNLNQVGWHGTVLNSKNENVLLPGSKLPASCRITYHPPRMFFGNTAMTYSYRDEDSENNAYLFETLIFQVIPCKQTLLDSSFDTASIGDSHKEVFDIPNTPDGTRLNLLENQNTAIDTYGLCLLPESKLSKESRNQPQSLRFYDIAHQLGLNQKQSETRTTPNCIFDSYDHELDEWDKGAFCMEETLTGGMCVGDADGDSIDDIYYPRLDGADVLLLNRGDGSVVDMSKVSNVESITSTVRSNGCHFIDIDNDGDNDIYITTVGDERFYLLVNTDGLGTFHEEALERGLANLKKNNRLTAGFSIAIADYNVDGWLDIVTTEWMPMLERKGKLKRTAWHNLVDEKDTTNSRIFKNIGKLKPGYFIDATKESTIMSRIPRGTGRDFLNDVDENPRASLCSGITPNDLKGILEILEVNLTGIGTSVRSIRKKYEGVMNGFKKGTAAASQDNTCMYDLDDDDEDIDGDGESDEGETYDKLAISKSARNNQNMEERWPEFLYLPSLKSERFIKYAVTLMHNLGYKPPVIRQELRNLWRWGDKADKKRTGDMYEIMQKMEEKIQELDMSQDEADEYFKEQEVISRAKNPETGRVPHRMNHLADFPMIGRFEFGAKFSDLDNDTYPDLVISGDFGTSQMLWNQKNGTFFRGHFHLLEDLTDNSMGSTIGDWNMDGKLDVMFTSVSITEKDLQTLDQVATSGGMLMAFNGNHLFKNVGGRRFEDVTDKVDVRESGWGWGAFFADLDNDGDQDVFNGNGMDDPETTDDDFAVNQPARLYMNMGRSDNFKFQNEAQTRGIASEEDNRAALAFDFDQDGDLDILVANHASLPQLFLNNGGNYYDYLRVKVLEENGRISIGAKIYVKPTASYSHSDRVIEVGSTAAFLAQGESIAHFGFKKDLEFVYRVKIQWPRINSPNNAGTNPVPTIVLYNIPTRKTLIISRKIANRYLRKEKPQLDYKRVFLAGATTIPHCDGKLAIHSISQPKNGRISLDPSTRGVRYIPNHDFEGVETIRYTVRNAFGDLSNERVAKIRVFPLKNKEMKKYALPTRDVLRDHHGLRPQDKSIKNTVGHTLDFEQSLVDIGNDYPSIDALINTFQEFTNGGVGREKANMNILSALFGRFVLRDVAQVMWHDNNVTNEVSGWLDLGTIYSVEDEINCIDGKLNTSLLLENVDNQSSLKKDENKILFENLWNVIFSLAHNQLVEKHKNRFPSLSAVELYRWARERNIAQYQSLLFYDWLPKFVGLVKYNRIAGKYKGFQKNVNAQVSLSFVLSLSLFTQVTTSTPMEFGNDIGEMLLEASAQPFNPDSNFIDLIDIQHLKSLLRKTRSLGILPYQEICKKSTYSCPAELENDELHREVYKLYSKEKKGIDFIVGILLDAADFSNNDKAWKYIVLEQFKKLRDGDSMWYESVESDEIISQLSEISMLGFLRNTLKKMNLKVGFTYDYSQ